MPESNIFESPTNEPTPSLLTTNRFYTIEDFDTKEALDAYITEVILKKLFIPLTEDEIAARIKYVARTSYYRKKYRQTHYEVKFYIHNSLIFKFLVSLNEYKVIPEPYYPSYATRHATVEQQEKAAMKELTDIPVDIFLGLMGFQSVTVSYKGFKSKERHVKGERNHKVLMAWILCLPTFRQFNNYSDKGSFREAYATIERHNEHAPSLEKLYNQYLPLYKLNETWKELT